MARVLITRLSSLGDVAMLVPAVVSVAAKYPQDRFTVLTRVAFAPLFQNLGFNINVIPIDTKKRHKGVLGFFKTLKKAISFSHIVDEHDVLRTKILRWTLMLMGKKVAHINKGREDKARVIATKQTNPPLRHTIERYMDTFEKLGFKADLTFSNFYDFLPRELSEISSVCNNKDGLWIGIAPFAKHKGKIYPLDKMEKVVEKLSYRNNTKILLFGGGKEERIVLSAWAKKYPNIINLAGKQLKIMRELLIMSYLDVMVSMDSANMHLASLVQVPVISIWGATHPSLGFYGYNQDPDNAIQADLACRPCSVFGNTPCENEEQYECMSMIDESMILNKIESVLSKQSK